jgi:hypothetical protein
MKVFSVFSFIMLMVGGLKRRFVDWLFDGYVSQKTRALPAPALEGMLNMSFEDRQSLMNRLLEGVHLHDISFGEHSVKVGGPNSNIRFVTVDSTLDALGQFGGELTDGFPQWYGPSGSAQQRSIFDSGGGDFIGLPASPSGPTAAASKAYVDGLIAGGTWLAPACVLSYIGNNDVTTINNFVFPSAALKEGDAYVMTDAGNLTEGVSIAVATGDLVEFDGTQWRIIEVNSGGAPPAGTRCLVDTTTALIAPLTNATDDGKIAEFAGSTLTPALSSPANGDAVLINCKNTGGTESVYENEGYSFQGTVPTGVWTLFQGAIPNHSALLGLTSGTGQAQSGTGDAGHTQFSLLAGRTGGQVHTGGTAAAENFVIEPTSGGTGLAGIHGQTRIAGDVFPGDGTMTGTATGALSDNLYDLGVVGGRWAEIHGRDGQFNGIVIKSGGGGTFAITPSGDNAGSCGTAALTWGTGWFETLFADATIYGGDQPSENLVLGSTTDVAKGHVEILSGTTSLRPQSDDLIALGGASNRWTTAYVQTVEATTSVIPEADGAGALGTVARTWGDLRIVTGTHEGNLTMLGDLEYKPSGPNIGVIGTTSAPFKRGAFGDASGTLNALDLYSHVEVHGDYDIFPETDEEGRIGIEPVSATGVLTGTANFIAGENVNAGGKTYLFQASVTGGSNIDGYVLVGVDLATSLANLASAINNAPGGTGSGVVYAANTVANGSVTAVSDATTLTVTAITPGTAWNSLVTTETGANASWGAGTMSGGIDGLRFKEVNAAVVTGGDFRFVDKAKNAAWRLVEEPDKIVFINELTGKQFCMSMEAMDEDEYVSWPGLA